MKMDLIISKISYYTKLVAAPFSAIILVVILTSCGKDNNEGGNSSLSSNGGYESYIDIDVVESDDVSIETAGDEIDNSSDMITSGNVTSDESTDLGSSEIETSEVESSNQETTSEDVKDTTPQPTTTPKPTTTQPTTTPKPTTTQPTTTPKPTTTKPTTKLEETSKQEETTTKPKEYDIKLELPSATGVSVSNLNGYIIDYSNVDSGYVMIKAEVDAEAVVQVRLNDKKGDLAGQYVLKISNNYVAIPLTKGNATYCVRIMQKNPDTGKYAEKNAVVVTPNIANDRQPFKMPNIYVYYMKSSTAVNLSYMICDGLASDEAKVKAIYDYITKNIKYDYNFAKTATAGYMDSERCLKNKMGICGDYSVLFATMCRAQGIPCVVIEGYVTADGQVYHAWNQVYYNKEWHFYDTTFDASGGKGKNYLESFRY